jgi:hypothetical protein
MNTTHSQVQLLDAVQIEIFPEDLAAGIKTRGNKDKILEVAGNLLSKVQGNWQPRAVFRWLEVKRITNGLVILKSPDSGKSACPAKCLRCLNLGFASRFMTAARYGLVAVFTAGDELEAMVAMASEEKRIMDAYLYDIIGLAVLEKLRQQINLVVEDKAREMNWGVGPFLSPGSVHGWGLEDQNSLCDLVPMERIGVKRCENGILKPFKTLSCLVGIGPDFSAKTVGETCEVCLKKDQCEIRSRQ